MPRASSNCFVTSTVARAGPDLVDAATLARLLNVDRDWVYANARRLGAVRLGDGPKARLRFDATRARAALAAAEREHQPPRTSRDARHAGALAGDPCLGCSSSRGGLAGERGPCNAPTLRSPRSGGCANTPGPGTGGQSDASRNPSSGRRVDGAPACAAGSNAVRLAADSASASPSRIWGTEYYEHFGGEWEGWDEQRATDEQRFLMEKVNRGEWTPPPDEPARSRRRTAADLPG